MRREDERAGDPVRMSVARLRFGDAVARCALEEVRSEIHGRDLHSTPRVEFSCRHLGRSLLPPAGHGEALHRVSEGTLEAGPPTTWNSVDTGPITDPDPTDSAARKVQERASHPARDVVDGVAPIGRVPFESVRAGGHRHGLFCHHDEPAPW